MVRAGGGGGRGGGGGGGGAAPPPRRGAAPRPPRPPPPPPPPPPQCGYSLLEISVTLAIFGIFLMIVVTLTAEMRRNEKKWPVDLMTHPEVGAVMARLRRDVYDAKFFPATWQKYNNSAQTPILYTINPQGGGETIVWDFSMPGEVTRHAWTANLPQEDWVAHATPAFTSEEYDDDSGKQIGLHVSAIDQKGKIAIDQIFIQRPHD
jgi:prepilin-type N-terminal cleavage/methylation domain-containing protein